MKSPSATITWCVNAKGDEEAWSTLIDKYKNLIFSIPVKYGFHTHDADEIFQEVCLALLTELPRLRKPQALAGWLIQATSHRCFHRKREQGRYVGTEPDETFSSAPAAEDILREVERERPPVWNAGGKVATAAENDAFQNRGQGSHSDISSGTDITAGESKPVPASSIQGLRVWREEGEARSLKRRT